MQFYKKGIVAGVFAMMAFVVASTIAFGIVMTLFDISDEIVSIVGTLILALGCYLASYVSTQIVRNNGLIQGLIVGGIVSSVLLIIGIIVNRELTVACFEKMISSTLFSIIGGIKGINTRKTGK